MCVSLSVSSHCVQTGAKKNRRESGLSSSTAHWKESEAQIQDAGPAIPRCFDVEETHVPLHRTTCTPDTLLDSLWLGYQLWNTETSQLTRRSSISWTTISLTDSRLLPSGNTKYHNVDKANRLLIKQMGVSQKSDNGTENVMNGLFECVKMYDIWMLSICQANVTRRFWRT